MLPGHLREPPVPNQKDLQLQRIATFAVGNEEQMWKKWVRLVIHTQLELFDTKFAMRTHWMIYLGIPIDETMALRAPSTLPAPPTSTAGGSGTTKKSGRQAIDSSLRRVKFCLKQNRKK